MGNHHQVRGIAVFYEFLQDTFPIQFGLVFRYGTRWPKILNGRRATKRKRGGVDAAAIGACQNLPDCNAMSSEGCSDTLGLLYTAGRKVHFLCAVTGREMPYPFLDFDVRMAQQDNLAALL